LTVENLSHTLLGIAIANSGVQQRHGPVATWGLAIAANLPDIDTVVRFWGTEHYLIYHRTLTHSVFGLLILPLLLAYFLRVFNRSVPFRSLYLIGVVGVLSHITLDLLTAWGTMLFFPLVEKRFSLPWVFIIDPYVLGILILSVLIIWILPKYRETSTRVAISALGLYVAFCGWNWALAVRRIETVSVQRGYQPQQIQAYAQPLSPFQWMGVIQEKGTVHLWMVETTGNPDRSRKETIESYPTNLERQEVQAVLKTQAGKQFLSWSQLPIASVESLKNGHRVAITDVRFRTKFRQMNPFVLTVDLDKDLKPIRAYWPWNSLPPRGT
jgi:inner membrane protein